MPVQGDGGESPNGLPVPEQAGEMPALGAPQHHRLVPRGGQDGGGASGDLTHDPDVLEMFQKVAAEQQTGEPVPVHDPPVVRAAELDATPVPGDRQQRLPVLHAEGTHRLDPLVPADLSE
jgi:hypothetical protein